MMEAWTSGKCVATLHRVIFPKSLITANEPARPRKSIAYFGTPDGPTILRPVRAGGIIEDNGKAISVKEFFDERLRLGFPDRPKAGPERLDAASGEVVAAEA